MAHWMSYTDGVFDIEKQSINTAAVTIYILVDMRIVRDEDFDVAAELAAQIMLVFRTSPALVAAGDTVDIEVESHKLATIMVEALIEKGIVDQGRRTDAIEGAAEELLVQWGLEDI